MKAAPSQVNALILGEHGDSMVPIWSSAAIGGLPLDKYPGWTNRLADELFETNRVSDELWTALEKVWNTEQLVELVAIAGQYRLVSYFVNAFAAMTERQVSAVVIHGSVIPGSPAEFGKFIAEETEKWGKVIRAANIKPE